MKSGIINISSIPKDSLRIDPSLHLSEGVTVRNILNKYPNGLKKVCECSKKIFLGNIFSRCYVKDETVGIVYLSPSDTVKANLDTGKYLSKEQANQLSYLKIDKDWILVTCSGTLGCVTYTNETFRSKIASHDLIRIIPLDKSFKKGCLYAFLASKYGYYQLTQSRFGGVVKHINDKQAGDVLVPNFPVFLQNEVDNLIQESANLREKADSKLRRADSILKENTGLKDLSTEDYDYYGPRSNSRKVSTFCRSISEIGSLSFHAFNYSERIRKNILSELNKLNHISFYDALDSDKLQSPSGVEVNELKEGHGIMLINQSDIFDRIVKGKWVVKKEKYLKDLLKKDEILIAKIGTLGENETFCRCIYVGENLEGQLISSAFYRMKASDSIPPGYLYAWLSSDYGFRLIRSSQYGTKQCYPNPSILYKYPVPIIEKEKMNEIDTLVKESSHLNYMANQKELKAIRMVEEEIEKWNN